MDRRQSSYGPSWSDVEQWVRALEVEYGAHVEFRFVVDPGGKLGTRFRLHLVVLGATGEAQGKTIYTDWRAYPQKHLKSVPEAMHALLVGAWSQLDGRRQRALSAGQDRLPGM